MRNYRARTKLAALESLESRRLLHGNLGLTIGEVEVRENVGFVTVSVLRSGAFEDTVTVDYTTVNDSADASDFEPLSGTFTFPPNVAGQQIQIRITDDSESELSEEFRFELSNPTNGAEIGQASQTIRILDDDVGSSQALSLIHI